MEKLSKLERLLIGEVSGVDDPANEIPGWMVMKSREDAAAAASEERKPTLVEKLSGFFNGTDNDEEEIEMTKEELTAELDTRFAALTESLSKSVEEPAAPEAEEKAEIEKAAAEKAEAEKAEAEKAEAIAKEAEEKTPAAEVTPEAAPAVDADAIAKAIEDGTTAALAPVLDILDAVIDRFEPIERALAVSKSLPGQEGAEGEAKEPNVGSAIRKALSI